MSKKPTLKDLQAQLDAMEYSRDAWKEDARRYCRNEVFYRDLLKDVKKVIGVDLEKVLYMDVPYEVKLKLRRTCAGGIVFGILLTLIAAVGFLYGMRVL
jgi:hypothetical protein